MERRGDRSGAPGRLTVSAPAARGEARVVVAGEALIDLVPGSDGLLAAHDGGGPFNAARTIARLGCPVAFLGCLSTDAYGRRLYIAGVVPNTPENLVRWIRFPTSVDPRTAMPDLHLSDQDARDMAAYLYTME